MNLIYMIQVALIGGGYLGNIGNGFIEKGVKVALNQILNYRDCNIWSMNFGEFSRLHEKTKSNHFVYDSQVIDVLIVAGMIMNNTFFAKGTH